MYKNHTELHRCFVVVVILKSMNIFIPREIHVRYTSTICLQVSIHELSLYDISNSCTFFSSRTDCDSITDMDLSVWGEA